MKKPNRYEIWTIAFLFLVVVGSSLVWYLGEYSDNKSVLLQEQRQYGYYCSSQDWLDGKKTIDE